MPTPPRLTNPVADSNPYESPQRGLGAKTPETDSRPSQVRYLVIGLGMAMSVLLYLDRFALSPATDSILRELQITKEEFGRTYFAFFFAYALMQVPAGWLSDRFGARATLALYVVGWSAATVCLGLAGGLTAILLLRLALGVTQAGAYPAAASLLKRWIPPTSRGRANTCVAMGGRAGGLIAFFCTPLLMLFVGQWLGWETGRWRAVFVFYGSLGFAWAVLFWYLYRDLPGLHPWCNTSEIDLIGQGVSAGPQVRQKPVRLFALAESPEVWLICGCNCAVNLGWIFLATWLPQYLVEAHGNELAEIMSQFYAKFWPQYLAASAGPPGGEKLAVAGIMTAMTGLAGIFGGLIGGTSTDLLARRFGLAWGRRLPGLCAGGVVCGLYLAASHTHDVWFFVGTMVLISFTIEFGLGASWAIYQDIAGRHVASVLGIGNMCGNLAAGVFAWLIGVLAEKGNWQTVFYISAAAMALNSVCWFFFDASRKIWPEGE